MPTLELGPGAVKSWGSPGHPGRLGAAAAAQRPAGACGQTVTLASEAPPFLCPSPRALPFLSGLRWVEASQAGGESGLRAPHTPHRPPVRPLPFPRPCRSSLLAWAWGGGAWGLGAL